MNIGIKRLSKVGKTQKRNGRWSFRTLGIRQRRRLYENFSDHPLRYPAWLKSAWTTKGSSERTRESTVGVRAGLNRTAKDSVPGTVVQGPDSFLARCSNRSACGREH